ncbi:Pvc16 family protein [Streptomyces flaveus]|uniref:Pvc16 family protein n=1 Tax=Streptomyces flaveus TaxID=66370 RepID=UPI00332717B0
MDTETDSALRKLFTERMISLGAGEPGGVAAEQIGFGPPDSDWAGDVTNLAPKLALNVYLVDLRENRALRSNERMTSVEAGRTIRRQATARVDWHYLISAWSGSSDRRTATQTEHTVLSEAVSVLVQAQVLTTPDGELPIEVAPPGGFPELADFWGSMGEGQRWRPVILLIVTTAVMRAAEAVAPEVTTRFTEYRITGEPGSAETRIQIAGVVRDTGLAPPALVPGAWVQLETAALAPVAATRTNSRGEFTFLDIAPGAYQLRLRTPHHVEPPVTPITVPEPTGRYDLALP